MENQELGFRNGNVTIPVDSWIKLNSKVVTLELENEGLRHQLAEINRISGGGQ